MCIHERKNWPKFNWQSEKVEPLLTKTRYSQGLIFGKMKSLDLISSKKPLLIY